MHRVLLVTLCFGLASCQPSKARLAGTWSVCATDSLAQSVCGTLQVGRGQNVAFNYRTYHPLTYQLDLAPLLGPNWTLRPECGSLLVEDNGAVTIMLGIECGAVLSFDGGNVVAERMVATGDSIYGPWIQSCGHLIRARSTVGLS